MQSTLGPLITNKSCQKQDKQSTSPMQNPPPNPNKCLCGQSVSPTAPDDTFLKCINTDCRNVFHKSCMKVIPSNQKYPLFECPTCVLSKSDPLHQVLKTLVPPFLVDNLKRDFLIDQAVLEKIRKSGNLGLEVRSIKLEDKTHDQCWPNTGELIINNIRVMEFRPLQQNSSLKKRKDEKLFTREVKLGLNSVTLKYVKPDPRLKKVEETYIAAIYIVRALSCDELVKKTQMESRRNIEECKAMIKSDFVSSGLEIAKMSYPMTCVFDMQLIKTPAKGIHCKHINCFSLENFVSVWQKNHQRKWNCPICKVKAYHIVVDSYLEDILKELQAGGYADPTQVNVEFNRDATYKFMQDDDDDMGSDSEDEKPKKEKASVKTEKPLKSTEKVQNIVILDSDEEEAPAQKPPVINIQSPVNENSIMQIEPEEITVAPRQEEPREKERIQTILTLSSMETSPVAREVVPSLGFVEESNNELLRNNEESKMQVEPSTKKQTMEEEKETEKIQSKQRTQEDTIVTQKPRSPSDPIVQTQLTPEAQKQTQSQKLQTPLSGAFQWSATVSKNVSPSQNIPLNFESQLAQEMPVNCTQITISSQSNPSRPTTPVQIPPFHSVTKDFIDKNPVINMFDLTELKAKAQKPSSENRDLHRVRQQQASTHITSFSQINDKIERIERILSENEALNPTKKKFNLGQENGLKENRKPNINRGTLEAIRIDSDNMVGSQKSCSKETLEETEKCIERLMEHYDARLDLPNFKNYKTKNFEELLLDKENGLQRSKKLLSMVMKQIPLQTAGIALRPSELEEIEKKYREKPSTSNMYTMSDHKTKINGRKNKRVQEDMMGLGNETNPICLD